MLEIELQTILSGYDRKTCWVHARPGAIAGDPPAVVVTMQKLRLSGSDVFYEINDLRTDDGGKTWIGPTPQTDTLGRRETEPGVFEGICDLCPAWHTRSGKLLGTGASIWYVADDHPAELRPATTGYTVYSAETRTWSRWARLDMPDTPKFTMSGAGCTQRVDRPDGDILLPLWFRLPGTSEDHFEFLGASTVARCSFDGKALRYVEHGTEMTLPTGRGLVEPSLISLGDRYLLTLRNNDAAYVTHSHDGLHFDEPRPWTFDDGGGLGSYNTQQHWVTHGRDLYLVYTRRGANNDHIFRHRAPLFIAQVDPDRLCVIRETEQVLVPERGARLGNFGVTRVSENETWVVVSEWMQTTDPDPFDCTVCERYGSDNSVFVARIRFG